MRTIVFSLAVCAAASTAALAAPALTPEETARQVGAPGEPELHGPAAAARELLAADRAFAVRAQEAGASTAFREFAEPTDARSFNGGAPFKGAEAVSAMPEWGAPLMWAPSEVFASTGNMGVDWGRWKASLPNGQSVTGVYIITWRKGADGKWKVLVDAGVPDAAPPKG